MKPLTPKELNEWTELPEDEIISVIREYLNKKKS